MKTIQISFRLLAASFMICMIAFCSQSIQANNAANSPMEILDSCPTAKFSIVNNGVDAGIPIHFDNQSTGGTSYFWDFGDGNSSSAENPSHTYASPGNYTVRLIVTGGGCTVEFIGTEDTIIN